MERRIQTWASVDDTCYDAVVIGGGINGASIYRALRDAGQRALLLDKGDFACGTSQASAMMVWGGILYLRNMHLGTVRQLCTARDRLTRDWSEMVRVESFRYIPTLDDRRHPRIVHAGMLLYWLLGARRTERPRRDRAFAERSMLNGRTTGVSLVWQEATVRPSDARFVLSWLGLDCDGPSHALNYCSLESGHFDESRRMWRLDVRDEILQRDRSVHARCVINAAGAWTDRVNRQFDIASPYRHVMSKGVFLGLPRDERHESTLLFEIGAQADAMALLPWGPISLWGPTETVVDGQPEDAYRVTGGDVDQLLSELNRLMHGRVREDDVVSLRCGVRPLVVRADRRRVKDSLSLTRGQRVVVDRKRPWISVYGGKLTSCQTLGRRVARTVERMQGMKAREHENQFAPSPYPQPETIRFARLEESFPSPDWCLRHESCWTLADYLRRRTNIAQWVDRGGLGRHNEYRRQLADIGAVFDRARNLCEGTMLKEYEQSMADGFDRILRRHPQQANRQEIATATNRATTSV